MVLEQTPIECQRKNSNDDFTARVSILFVWSLVTLQFRLPFHCDLDWEVCTISAPDNIKMSDSTLIHKGIEDGNISAADSVSLLSSEDQPHQGQIRAEDEPEYVENKVTSPFKCSAANFSNGEVSQINTKASSSSHNWVLVGNIANGNKHGAVGEKCITTEQEHSPNYEFDEIDSVEVNKEATSQQNETERGECNERNSAEERQVEIETDVRSSPDEDKVENDDFTEGKGVKVSFREREELSSDDNENDEKSKISGLEDENLDRATANTSPRLDGRNNAVSGDVSCGVQQNIDGEEDASILRRQHHLSGPHRRHHQARRQRREASSSSPAASSHLRRISLPYSLLAQWRQVGERWGLQNDNDIAQVLLQHYEDTLAGRPTRPPPPSRCRDCGEVLVPLPCEGCGPNQHSVRLSQGRHSESGEGGRNGYCGRCRD